MPIESDIIEAVETRLDNMKSGATYQLTWQYVETRDENIDPSAIDPATDTPIAFIRYGNAGDQRRRFLDTVRLGKVHEMLPIDVRVILYDTRSGDTITALIAKAREDIRQAIGDHLRTDVNGVTDAWVGPYFRPQATWFNDTEEFIVPLTVWFKYEQRDILASTPTTGQIIPQDIVFVLDEPSTDITVTFTVPADSDGVDIYRNGIEVVSLDNTGTYTDTSWAIDNTYRLVAVYGATEKSSETFGYPYYPSTSEEAPYYGQAWGNPTTAAPELLIENRIRREYEQLRDTGEDLALVSYTTAGPLREENLIASRMPLLHIDLVSSSFQYMSHAEDEMDARFRVHVFTEADNVDTDPAIGRMQANQILHGIRKTNSAQHAWSNVANAFDTPIQQVTWARDAEEIGFILAFHGLVDFTVRFRQDS